MKKPRVAILMGSDSDLPVMRKTAATIEDFGVPYRMTISSAHRTPGAVDSFIRRAERDGVGVFIAAAGAAAHLAGAVAGKTTRPVIGVPLGSRLAGFDSLLSTVQMPRGVPVATVAVDGAANAALLAVQILAVSDAALARRLARHKKQMESDVLRKAAALRRESQGAG